MVAELPRLAALAREAPHFERVVLCGMGGSSLAPAVFRTTFGSAAEFPSLTVLDSTDPRAVRAAVGNVTRTLFIVSSKSGTTLETDCFFRYFWERTGGRGAQFVAITDPGTPLAALAAERGFRHTFLNPPDIGGRYSALSFFGLVPAALAGIDVARLVERARVSVDAEAVELGATISEGALAGRDKLTLVVSPGVGTLGLWLEQLIAESTGKEGKGIVPVVDEPLGTPEVYEPDRLFVSLTLGDGRDLDPAGRLAALEAQGHPVVRLTLGDRFDLGREFVRWEFATAVAGSVLGINPFDQPNVAESKANTDALLSRPVSPSPAARRADLDRLVQGIRPGDYLALMAYVPPTPAYEQRLAALRVALRDRLRVATTAGYGPRLLHSTGQLHKGGPPKGHFIQITEPVPPQADVPVPGRPFTFGQVEAAQAEGDLQALARRGRPVLRLEGLALLEEITASGA